ncbi:MAG: Rrf2 family transcriptional regulator [Bdellovibrionaceae bacterium]|nr:Rrf2 family transcriptional regulator [Pseudobdellovibrionaceae bacterium]
MNKINRKLEYALMALKYLSQKIPGELTSAKEVSDSFSTPFDATARVMQAMAQNGLLRVEHGATGGYQITKDLSKVTMLSLLEIVEGGPTAMAKCMVKTNPCDMYGTCNIISPVQVLQNRLNDFYASITLKELLIESPKRKVQLEEAING